MSKINQIQQALKEIDQARFQKLCDAYLRRRGYDNINPHGSVIGKDKVRPGTPDTFVLLANGKYIFAEYTTQEGGVAEKFMKDLKKCFDSEKTGVPAEEIERVILCYNSQMDSSEVRQLRNFCAEKGCECDIYGIGVLSHDLAEKYPGIAKEYLSIDVDTGQILDQDRFIFAYQASTFATRIDTTFLGREADLEVALGELKANSVLLIRGRSGVGKTRFAIECCQRFIKENLGYEVRYIKELGADLFNDLRLHYKEPGRYIIVIDDANRLTGLDYVLSLLQEADAEHQFRIVCTVRDYAMDKVRRAVAPYATPAEIEILPFADDEIKQLVEVEYGIYNGEYVNRIARLSEGNPRIAMMAASIATKEQSLNSINDVSALYDQYFESITRDVETANDTELWRAAGVVTFFRTVDRTNTEQMELISSTFGLNVDAFWRNARRLHELESLPSAERDYPYKESVDDVVLDLLERDADMFVSVMNRYLADGDKLDLGRSKIVREMVARLGAEHSFEIINRAPLSKRDVWLGQYYESLPSDSVTEEVVTELMAFYQTSDPQSLPYRFDYLKRYLAIDPNIGTRIVRTLLDRGADDKRFLRLIWGLFNVLRRSEPDMEVIQSLEPPILQQAYLQVGDVHDHSDLHGIVFDFILNQNSDFLRAYIQHRYQILKRPRFSGHKMRSNFPQEVSHEQAAETEQSVAR